MARIDSAELTDAGLVVKVSGLNKHEAALVVSVNDVLSDAFGKGEPVVMRELAFEVHDDSLLVELFELDENGARGPLVHNMNPIPVLAREA